MPTTIEVLNEERRKRDIHRLTVGIGCLSALLLLLMIAGKAYDLALIFILTDCAVG